MRFAFQAARIRADLIAALLSCAATCVSFGATPTLTVDLGQSAGHVSPRMYGLMTEEINHSYDGGLYGELVQNRALLDDTNMPSHYAAVQSGSSAATIALDPKQPLNDTITTSLRLVVTSASAAAPAGVANEGYWGFPVTPGTKYTASFYAKAAPGFDGPITLALQSPDGETQFATAKVTAITGKWKKYQATLETGPRIPSTVKARYALTIDRPGTVWLSMVSLFPPTYNDRPNGFRKDLMQMLVDLHSKFLRCPGGNHVEGFSFPTRFDWKKTIGPIEQRAGHPGCWGYRSSDGMGLLEFCQWTQDMGAEPVLALFAGYTLDKQFVEAGPKLEPYVTEAVEEIEYVTGGPDTKWGKRRAADGHPKPFPLHYVEVGNEDSFDQSGSYDGRFTQFYEAIKKKYPQLKVISTIGNDQGKLMVKGCVPDAVDEHFYTSADSFIKLSQTHYDQYPRGKRPEIFVGEWASFEDPNIPPWSPPAKKLPPTPNMKAALGDACFMAGMERNADIVVMQCYAPMLVNVNAGAWQWRPDLIGYDAGHVFGSPSYYATKMFSTQVGDELISLKGSDSPVQASATRDSHSGEVFLKLVNPTDAAVTLHVNLKGVGSVEPTAKVMTMAADPTATNSLDQPTAVVPTEAAASDVKPQFDFPVPANGIVVMTLKTK
jgi:alpha-N-arabinofuranosidase